MDLAFGGMMVWWWLNGVNGEDALLELERNAFCEIRLEG
jgi:hypothetical protein